MYHMTDTEFTSGTFAATEETSPVFPDNDPEDPLGELWKEYRQGSPPGDPEVHIHMIVRHTSMQGSESHPTLETIFGQAPPPPPPAHEPGDVPMGPTMPTDSEIGKSDPWAGKFCPRRPNGRLRQKHGNNLRVTRPVRF